MKNKNKTTIDLTKKVRDRLNMTKIKTGMKTQNATVDFLIGYFEMVKNKEAKK